MDCNDHVAKRQTALGRRLPAILYAVNIAGWVTTAISIGVSQFLLLSLLTLPALALYVWRIRRL